jgi:hypothetical protein
VPGGADARGAMKSHPFIPGFADEGLTRVKAHPDSHHRFIGPGVVQDGALCGHGGFNGISRAGKHDDESVSLGPDFKPARVFERRAEEPVMFGDNAGVPITELFK